MENSLMHFHIFERLKLKLIFSSVYKSFRCLNRSGMSVLETAIILPVLVFLVLGGFEIGYYMLQNVSVHRSLANIANDLRQKPDSYTHADAVNTGTPVANLERPKAYNGDVCAQAYKTSDDAKNNGCHYGQWDITKPVGLSSSDPYYVAMALSVEANSISPLMDRFIDHIYATQVVRITPLIIVPAGTIMPFNLDHCPAGWTRFSPATSRNIVGAGGKYGFGATGGSDSYTLSLKQMPRHNHDMILTGSNVLVKVNNRSDSRGDESSVAFRTAGSGNKLHTSYDGGNCDDDKKCNDPYGSMDPYVALTYCQKL